MAELTAPQQNRLLGQLANMLRATEGDIAAPEFLPRGLDVMGLVRQLMLPSAETVEKLSYGDPLFRMPMQSNIPITADREYLADIAGMIPFGAPAARPTARGIQDLVRQIQTEPPTGAISPEIAARVLPETKVVDEAGNPRLLYHGTNKDYEKFSESMLGTKTGNPTSRLGYFFSGSPSEASRYAADWGKEGGNVRPVYLDIKNPKRLTYKEMNDISMAMFDESLPANAWKTEQGKEAIAAARERANKMAVDLRERLISEGYDGAVVRIGGQDEYIAFSPEQIRSATSDPQMASLLDEPAQSVATSPLENPNFRSWFEGSKITDEQGMPLTVYHGSGSADIKEFDLGNYQKVQKGDWGKGIYFTPSEGMAKSYRDTAVKAQDPKIKEALAKEESLAKEFGTRPMMKWMDLQSGKISQEQYEKLQSAEQNWRDAIKAAEDSSEGKVYDVYLNIKNPYYYTYSGITEPDLADQVRRAGHDGLIIQNEAGSIEEILVFDPKQIKSASENVGTYSQDTANIYRGIGVGGTGLLGAGMMQEEETY